MAGWCEVSQLHLMKSIILSHKTQKNLNYGLKLWGTNYSSVTVTAHCLCSVLTCELVKLWPFPSPPPLTSRCLCEVNGWGENRTSVLHCPGKWAGKWGAGSHTSFSGPAALLFWPLAVSFPLDPCCLNTAAMYEFSRLLKQADDLSLCRPPPAPPSIHPNLTSLDWQRQTYSVLHSDSICFQRLSKPV